jgi:hypothetical protein
MVRYQKPDWPTGYVFNPRVAARHPVFKVATVPRDRLPDGPGGERERPA